MELITNRTDIDVSMNTDIGNYNYTDLNRVAEACKELKEMMLSVGYTVVSFHKTDWTMYDYPTESAIAEYLSNVYKIISGFYSYMDYDLPDDLSAFTYIQANSIEKALQDIETIVSSIRANTIKSGRMCAGGSVIR